MQPEPIHPHKHSSVVVMENTDARLHVRTRLDSGELWFFAVPVLLLVIGLTGCGLVLLWMRVRDAQWYAVGEPLGLLAVGGVLGCVEILISIRQHLCVADGEIEFSRRFLRWTITRQRAAFAGISGLKIDWNEGSTSLVITTTRWEADFGGGDIGSETMDAVKRNIEHRLASRAAGS